MSKKKVMVIDADVESLMAISEITAKAELEIDLICCFSGYDAIKTLNQRDVDLIILAYRLPEITGLDMLRLIRRMRPDNPVVMLFPFENDSLVLSSYRSGVEDYLVKPFNPDKVIPLIRKYAKLKVKIEPSRQIIAEIDIYEPTEFLILSESGLPLYRRSTCQDAHQLTSKSIFTGVLAAIQMVISDAIEGEGPKEDEESLIIELKRLKVMIHPCNQFNIVLVGTGKNIPSEFHSDLKVVIKELNQALKEIGDKRIIDSELIEKNLAHLGEKLAGNSFVGFFES